MFSSAPSTRRANPRRRAREATEESDSLPKSAPKRQRRSLLPDQFEPPGLTEPTGRATRSKGTTLNGHADANGTINGTAHAKKDKDVNGSTTIETLSVRTTKKKETRGRPAAQKRDVAPSTTTEFMKSDALAVLHHTDVPVVVQDAIESNIQWQGSIFAHLGLALVLSARQATIWRVDTASSSNVGFTQPKTIRFPSQTQASLSDKETIPLGYLSHDSVSNSLGLLVVLPTQQRVLYWENVAQMSSSEDIDEQIAEPTASGSLASGFSFDAIQKITAAESDAFLVSTFSGRVIHISVRDAQGRPAISHQVLQTETLNATTKARTGFFGSLRNALTLAKKRNITALGTAKAKSKLSTSCVVAFDDGVVQIWRFARHGEQELVREVDLRELDFGNVGVEVQTEPFNILDIVVLNQKASRLRILTLIGSRMLTFELNLGDEDASIGDFTIIDDGAAGTDYKTGSLVSSSSGDLEIGFFDNTISILGGASASTLLFRTGCKKAYHVLGSTISAGPISLHEDTLSTFMFISHVGLVELQVSQTATKENVDASTRLQSALEQQTFYSKVPKNCFDLDTWQHVLKSIAVESGEDEAHDVLVKAVSGIAQSVLNSSASTISKVTSNMDAQLLAREVALVDLTKNTSTLESRDLTRWIVLAAAEKIAAARAIWEAYESALQNPETSSPALLLEIVDMIIEEEKHGTRSEKGEHDSVRQYMIHDVDRVGNVIAWANQAVEELALEATLSKRNVALLVSQANDIQTSALSAVFAFREAHFELYGGDGTIVNGIYQGDMSSTPDWWSSAPSILAKITAQCDLTRATFLSNDVAGDEDVASLEVLNKFSLDLPRLVSLTLSLYSERLRWLQAQPDDSSQIAAQSLQAIYMQVRHDQLVRMTETPLFEEALVLAERTHDLPTLCAVMNAITTAIWTQVDTAGTTEEIAQARADAAEHLAREASYFKKYGKEWASVLFTSQITAGEATKLLDYDDAMRSFKTEFFRENAETFGLSKLSWMNEVCAEKDYFRAHTDLHNAARQEEDLWSKKVQHSLAKLSLLAAAEKGQLVNHSEANAAAFDLQRNLARFDRRLDILRYQEEAYASFLPIIRGAIDDEAAVDLLLKSSARTWSKSAPVPVAPLTGTKGKKKGAKAAALLAAAENQSLTVTDIETSRPATYKELKTIATDFLSRKALSLEHLIDVLTLFCPPADLGGEFRIGDKSRWGNALTVLQVAGLNFGEGGGKLLQRLVYRRCLLDPADDWVDLNKTEGISDDAVLDKLRQTGVWELIRSSSSGASIPPFQSLLSFSASLSVEDLKTMFPRWRSTDEEHLAAILKDFEAEDEVLDTLVTEARLDGWYTSVMDGVKAEVNGEKVTNADADVNGTANGEDVHMDGA